MGTLERPISRRSLLLVGGGAVLGAAVPLSLVHAQPRTVEKQLIARPGRAALAGSPYPETDVWCYDGTTPGPEIRVRQGERLRIVVENGLPEDTTVHWHGLRVPNAMGGVPDLTQEPIAPGETFTYEFDVPDAGTYWYHPHDHSAEQVGRGLYGPLIIEEREPLQVDRDVVWVLGDWRLKRDASIVADFGNSMEMSMAGRVGNTVTINGQIPDAFWVRSGERIRLRLINAAPARIFGLEFKRHNPLIVALDGQPIEPHAPEDGCVVLGPAMRADVVLDMTGEPGSAAAVTDTFYKDLAYKLVDIAYTTEPRLRQGPFDPPDLLPANTMPEPDIERADRHVVTVEGGMMGVWVGCGWMAAGWVWAA